MAYATALLERKQELVPEKRVVAGELVPASGIGGGQRREAFESHLHSASVPVTDGSVELQAVANFRLGAS